MAKITLGTLSSFNHEVQEWCIYKEKLEQWFLANDITVDTDKAGCKRRAILLSNCVESTYRLIRNLALPREVGTLSYIEVEWKSGPEKDKLFTKDISELTLNKAIQIAEGVRCARMGAKETLQRQVEPTTASLHLMKMSTSGAPGTHGSRPDPQPRQNSTVASRSATAERGHINNGCTACGFTGHQATSCRFARYKCKKCGLQGHLKRVCKKPEKKHHFIECCSDGGDDGKSLCCNIRTVRGEPMQESVVVNNVRLLFEIDTGSPKNVKWFWSKEHEKAVSHIKRELVADTTLAHFNPNANLIVTVDASPHGLGAILSQVEEESKSPRSDDVSPLVCDDSLLDRSTYVRNSNHSTTNRSPAEVLFGRKLRCRLDILMPTSSTPSDSALDEIVKSKQCLQSDTYRGNRKVYFSVGEQILVRMYGQQKHKWVQGSIVKKNGNSIYIVQIGNTEHTVKRHANQLLKYKEENEVLPAFVLPVSAPAETSMDGSGLSLERDEYTRPAQSPGDIGTGTPSDGEANAVEDKELTVPEILPGEGSGRSRRQRPPVDYRQFF
ncbi:unnamed protein product [Arctia plantaginis]|uniref:CCHC-type domain-containing protein n=1 Tax=Arctia plantaginis TaxID=874455 RepID=A0A8S1AWC8_ARCPL|nr:unnamed protein product [Arctia plantaginis]